MPAWWGRKSSKNKEQRQQREPHAGGPQFNFIKSPIRNGAKKEKDKPKSFDEFSALIVSRDSPRASKDFTSVAPGVVGSSSGFSFCDSDGGEKRGHPLPRPSVSSSHSFEKDQGGGLGSASISGSSVSSTGSYDDHPISQSNGSRSGF